MSAISSFWTTLALAIGIAVVALARGHVSGGLLIALIALLVLGALLPVAGFLVGGVALVYVLFVHGPQLAGQLNSLFGGTQP